MYNVWLHRYAVLLAACTLFLVVAGALVTSNDAGLSVPDWPLSYGRLMPQMTGGIFYEHGHRMVATTVGFMTIILAVWLWRADERPWMKRLGVFTLLGVIVQGVLGGLTVIFMLPKAISIAHACLAELFFSTTVAIAVFTSRGWRRQPEIVNDEGWPSLRSAAVLLPLLVLAQVALGAAFRHRALNVLPHVFGALVVTGFILYVAICAMEHPSMKKPAVSLLSITFFQVFLGIAAYMSRISTIESVQPLPVMVAFTVAHVAVGALTMAGSVILSIYLLRSVRRPVVGLRQAA